MPCIGKILRREIEVVVIIVRQETISKSFVSTFMASPYGSVCLSRAISPNRGLP